MNKSIEELAKQAGIMLTPWYRDEPPRDVTLVHMDSSIQLEKFAELIVKECMNIVDDIDPKEAVRGLEDIMPYTVVATVLDNYLETVKQHFGVE